MLLTTKQLSKRWNVSVTSVNRIPPSELPRMNISVSKKRPTYRFHIDDVKAYERKCWQGK